MAGTALGIPVGSVVARRPVRIGFVWSVVRVKKARAGRSAVMIRGTSIINFRLPSHPCVPLVRWLKRHCLRRCCDRQGEHYGEKPHYSFLLAQTEQQSLECRDPRPDNQTLGSPEEDLRAATSKKPRPMGGAPRWAEASAKGGWIREPPHSDHPLVIRPKEEARRLRKPGFLPSATGQLGGGWMRDPLPRSLSNQA